MNDQMHWAIRATCSVCVCETTAPPIMGIPAHCDGCSALIKIDPMRTVFHRNGDRAT